MTVREPELVGPNREDVTGLSERKLQLRALHESLLTRQEVHLSLQQGELLRVRIDDQEKRHNELAVRVAVLEASAAGESPAAPTAASAVTVPPPRQRFKSSHDVAEAVGNAIAQNIEAESRNPMTPSPPPIEKVRELAVDAVQIAVDHLKAKQWDRLEAERKAADDDRLAERRARRKAMWAAIGMGIVAVGSIIHALVEHYSR